MTMNQAAWECTATNVKFAVLTAVPMKINTF
jgi:hypothetical protein